MGKVERNALSDTRPGAGAFDYGTAERPVSAAGAYSGGENAALVKYPRE
jgi:hypothetical protein